MVGFGFRVTEYKRTEVAAYVGGPAVRPVLCPSDADSGGLICKEPFCVSQAVLLFRNNCRTPTHCLSLSGFRSFIGIV